MCGDFAYTTVAVAPKSCRDFGGDLVSAELYNYRRRNYGVNYYNES